MNESAKRIQTNSGLNRRVRAVDRSVRPLDGVEDSTCRSVTVVARMAVASGPHDDDEIGFLATMLAEAYERNPAFAADLYVRVAAEPETNPKIRSISSEVRQRILDHWKNGVRNISFIARDCGVTWPTVKRVVRSGGGYK